MGMVEQEFYPVEVPRGLGRSGGGPYDIARAALIAEIAEGAKQEGGLVVRAEDGARALSTLMVGRFGYDGDRLSYDNPNNADLMSVIDRRRGLPVALGILYIHAARAAGLKAVGLSLPGHFLLRIETGGT